MGIDQQLNQERFDQPQPGDYWHERFCATLLVLMVLPSGHLVVTEDFITIDGQRQFDIRKAQEITRSQFARRVQYINSQAFCSDAVINKCAGYVRDWEALDRPYKDLHVHFYYNEVDTQMRPSEELDRRGYDDPQPGDYWSDHMVAQVLVLKALPNGNVVVVTDVQRDHSGQLFLLEKAREIDKAEFAKVTCRNVNGGHGCSMLTGTRAAHELLEIWQRDFNEAYARYTQPIEPTPTEVKIRHALTMPTLMQALTYIVEWEADQVRVGKPKFGGVIEEVLNRYGKPQS